MPMDQWPSGPESFADILPEGLPQFLQTGVTAARGGAISVIDPQAKGRSAALGGWQNCEPFCQCPRAACPSI